VGLSLQATAGSEAGAAVAERLNAAITDLDDTIRQVRSTIYELGSAEFDQGVRARVLALVRDLSPVVGFDMRTSFGGAVDTMISNQLAEHLLVVLRGGDERQAPRPGHRSQRL
jgi:signal transduction histidine kinase